MGHPGESRAKQYRNDAKCTDHGSTLQRAVRFLHGKSMEGGLAK